jgi:hypothetical protein
MRAARKVGALSKKIEKAPADRKSEKIKSAHSGVDPKHKVLERAGISTQQASDWERLSDVPEDQFEGALATKSVRELIDTPTPVSDDALLFIGTMRDFERRGYLARTPADIKANGLRFPIVRDKEGKTLIDGRNRLKACEIAGVKPTFRNLDGEDPVAFHLSSNIARRNLNKGQQAILLARIFPEVRPGKKNEALTTSAETARVSYRRVAED